MYIVTEIKTSTVEIKDERVRPIQKAKVRSSLLSELFITIYIVSL